MLNINGIAKSNLHLHGSTYAQSLFGNKIYETSESKGPDNDAPNDNTEKRIARRCGGEHSSIYLAEAAKNTPIPKAQIKRPSKKTQIFSTSMSPIPAERMSELIIMQGYLPLLTIYEPKNLPIMIPSAGVVPTNISICTFSSVLQLYIC